MSALNGTLSPAPEPYVSEAERMRLHLRNTLTPRQRFANWWHYHWFYLAAALAALLVIAGFALLDFGIDDPDYVVGWVSARELDDSTAQQLSEWLAQYGEDRNDDGTVTVRIHQIAIDLGAVIARGGTEGQKEYGALLALEADLSSGESCVFLTDDAAAFQQYTGALLYRDGSCPARDAQDWQNMVVPLEPDGISLIYAGRRGCWNDRQQAQWTESGSFWSRLAGHAPECLH